MPVALSLLHLDADTGQRGSRHPAHAVHVITKRAGGVIGWLAYPFVIVKNTPGQLIPPRMSQHWIGGF